jgi:hypothetical protein
MSLPIKKLYLDSRYRRHDSASNSNCKFELKQAIHLPLNCIAYIDDIQIPHTWYNVSPSNNKLYIRINTGALVGDYIITLDTKNYTVAELATDLNSKFASTIPNNTVTCSHNVRKSTITITSHNNYNHRIFSDEELADMTNTLNGDVAWSGGTINATNPQSLNDVIKVSGATNYVQHSTPEESGFINLRSVHNIYVTSPNLGSFDTLGPRGEQNIVKKVPVSSDWGYVIFDSVVSEHDYIDVSKGYFKTIELVLRDVRGNVIDLNKAHWSLSIVFSMMKEKDI